MAVAIYLFFLSIGILGFLNYKYWTVILAFFAFIPSMTFFSGINDYAMRLGVLSWLIVAIFLKRHYKVNWKNIYILWMLIAFAGIIGYIYYGVGLVNGLGTAFTPAGFSMQYVLLTGAILAGRKNMNTYINSLIIFSILFYVVGGIYQRFFFGELYYINPDQAFMMTPFYFNDGRMVGLFASSSHLTAGVLNITFSFILAKILYSDKNKINIVILVMILAGIILAQNRANYIAVTGVVLYTISKLKLKKKYVISIFFILLFLLVYFYLPDVIGKYQYQDRILNVKNIEFRISLYTKLFKNIDNIFSQFIIGYGFSPRKAIGLEYWSKFTSLGLGENQISSYIGKYGVVTTIIIVLLVINNINKLYYYHKLDCGDWIGNGILLSWISLIICYMVGNDTHYLIPFIFVLSSIWVQEKRHLLMQIRK